MSEVLSKLRRPAEGVTSMRRRVRDRVGLPPHRPRGWSVGAPDFVGVGAQRSGTSWWHRLICDHPGVHHGPKEQHFFDDYRDRRVGDAEVDLYHRQFPRPPGRLAGEWTPRYMHDHWTPAMIAQAAPDALILILLRDPWERFRSGVAHQRQVLSNQLRRDRSGHLDEMIVADALSRSLYAEQVTRIYDHFDPSRVLILQYERCASDPDASLGRTYEFLGLPPNHMPDDLTAPTGRFNPDAAGLDANYPSIRSTFRRDLIALAELAPELDFDIWPSVGS